MLDIKQLPTEQLASEEEKIFSFSGEEKIAVAQELRDFFVSNTPSTDFDYIASYFRWHVLFTWRRLQDVSRDDMVQFVIPRQTMVALALDFDVWLEIIWYLNLCTHDEAEMKMVYEKMRNSFFQSPAIIGKAEGKEMTQVDMIKEIQLLDRRGNDALAMAEFYSKYSTILTKSIPEYDQLFPISKEKVLRAFVDLTHFFMGVDAEKIYLVVDTSLHEEKYQAQDMRLQLFGSRYFQSQNQEDSESPEEEDIAAEPAIETQPGTVVEPSVYKKIQQDLQMKFTLGADGQFENIEGVMGYLDDMATTEQNEKIRDLYIFNENTGLFEWNTQLIEGTI